MSYLLCGNTPIQITGIIGSSSVSRSLALFHSFFDTWSMPISPTNPSFFSAGLQGLNRSNMNLAQSSERLSTGLRINRGADDPAGLIASEHLDGQLASIAAESKSLQRSNMNLATEDSVLAASSRGVRDLRSLVVQGANSGALTGAELEAISNGASGIIQGLTYLAQQSGSETLSGISVERNIGTDPGTGDPIFETITMSDLPALIESDPETAQELVDAASSAVTTRQAEIGAEQRSNESMQRAMEEEQVNVARAQSSIRDADYAKEASESVRASILGKTSMKAILIGQQQAKSVLDLLS